MAFLSKEELKRAVDLCHIKKHRIYIVVESKLKTWAILCASCGSENECKWRLHASFLKKKNFWIVSRYDGPHTCLYEGLSRDHKHIGLKLIATVVRHIMEKDFSVNIEAIIASVKEQFGYTISHKKIWYGKQKTLVDIYGEWNISYMKLPYYMAALQNANCGTIVY